MAQQMIKTYPDCPMMWRLATWTTITEAGFGHFVMPEPIALYFKNIDWRRAAYAVTIKTGD